MGVGVPAAVVAVAGAGVGAATSAGAYDRWFDEPWGRYAFAVESAAVLRAAGPLAGARLLDGGCGTGRFGAAAAAAGAPGLGAAVVGIDPDADMLGIAGPRLKGGCVRGVLEHLPFPDAAFDVTLGVTVLEFVTDPAVALAEMARVTRRGGRVVVGALNPRSPWGVANRRRLRSGVWCDARFLGRAALRSLGAAHGRATLHAALYAAGAFPGLARFGRAIEVVGRAAPAWGAFQVLVIDLPRGDG